MDPKDIGIVLLAAGRASRYGGPKQLVPTSGIPMVRRAALTALECARPLVVVTGAYRREVEACLAGLDVGIAFNGSWRDGMGASIARGVGHLLHIDANLSACMIMLADQPWVTSADLAELIAAHQTRGGCIIASGYDDKTRGPPCVFPRSCFVELMNLIGTGGAGPLLRDHADLLHIVPNPRAGVDIDVPEDLLPT